MKTELAILVPVYNGEAYLKTCLESILNQDMTDFVLRVIDNASTDGTADIVAAMDDPRIDYQRFDTLVNLSGNLNRCIEQADATFFCMVHADDRIKPDFARRLLAAIKADPEADIVVCRGELIDEDGTSYLTMKQRFRNRSFRRRGPLLEGAQGLKMIASYNHIIAPCAIYRTAALPEHVRYSPHHTYLTDQDFWLRYLHADGRIRQIEPSLYEHRVHRRQLSSSHRSAVQKMDEYAHILADHPAMKSSAALRQTWRRHCATVAARDAAASLLKLDFKSGIKQLSSAFAFASQKTE